MANEEHLAQVKQGVEAWNQWREANRNIGPDPFSLTLSRVRSSAPQPVPPFLHTTSQLQPQANCVSLFCIFAMHSKEGKCRGDTGT
jgi:hypothetical protein